MHVAAVAAVGAAVGQGVDAAAPTAVGRVAGAAAAGVVGTAVGEAVRAAVGPAASGATDVAVRAAVVGAVVAAAAAGLVDDQREALQVQRPVEQQVGKKVQNLKVPLLGPSVGSRKRKQQVQRAGEHHRLHSGASWTTRLPP